MNAKNIKIFVPDKFFLMYTYRKVFGEKLDLRNPQSFNEKLQWLKLYNRKPIYTIMVDKYEAKKYVSNIIGDKYVIPTLGVWKHFDDIDFKVLPDQFVLKCTHDSGGIVICKDKANFDTDNAKEKIEKCLKRNFYWVSREWPYKNVKPRVIAEKYMINSKNICSNNILQKDNIDLLDYKIFCFNGEPKIILVCSERFSQEGYKADYYDLQWNHLPVRIATHDNSSKEISKPKRLSQMLHLSKALSAGIPFIRVDFYEINEKIYFGELTFFPASGFEAFEPEEWDYRLGKWIQLPEA